MLKNRQELYKSFIDYIRLDVQRERRAINRRMLSVFFWCFLLPALFSISLLLLVKFGVLPRSSKGLLDWVVLVFPIFYSLYILSSEVLREVPAAFRHGG